MVPVYHYLASRFRITEMFRQVLVVSERLFAVKQLIGKRYCREVLVELVVLPIFQDSNVNESKMQMLEFDRPCWDMVSGMVLRELKEI